MAFFCILVFIEVLNCKYFGASFVPGILYYMSAKNYLFQIGFIGLFLLLIGGPVRLVANSNEASLSLKGEDYPTEKKTTLSCSAEALCLHFKEELKKTVIIELTGNLEGKHVSLQIEVPAIVGAYRLKLDKDGDQKPGEKFYLEISGSNAPVDRVVYTLEDESDGATVEITDLSEESGRLTGTFSGRFFDGATGVKRVQVSGAFSVN